MLKSLFGRDGLLPFLVVLGLIGAGLMRLENRVHAQASRATVIRIKASEFSGGEFGDPKAAAPLASLLKMGDSLERRGEGLRAARLFQDSAETASDSLRGYLLFKAGQMLMAMDEDSLAAGAFRKSLRSRGRTEDARLMLAITRPDGDTSLGGREAMITRLLDRHPDYAPGYFRLGLVRQKRKALPEALEAYDRALALFPAYKEARWNMALVLAALGRNEEALSQFQRLAALFPSRPEYHFNVGRYQRKLNRMDLAAKAYHKAISVKGGAYPEAYYNLALLFQDQGRDDSAEAYLKKALSLRTDFPEAWFNRGLLVMRRKAYAEAAACFGTASTQVQGYREAHFNRGLSFAKLGLLDSAIQEYRAAVQADPAYAKARLALALRLGQAQRDSEAVAAYREGIRRDAKNAEFWFGLGQALRRLDSLPQAAAAYRKAVELEPEDDKAWNNLGLTLASQGDRPGARSVFQAGVEKFPAHVGMRFNLSLQFARLDDTAAAMHELGLALRLDPGHAASNRLLGDLLMAKGEAKQSVGLLARAVREDPEPRSYLSLARAHLLARQGKEAVAVLSEGMKRHPSDSTLRQEWMRLRLERANPSALSRGVPKTQEVP